MPEIPFVPSGPIGATARRNTSRCTVPFGRPLLQIGGDRLADVARQREAVLVTSLAMDHDLAGPPVDVLQAEAGDLAGPQPEAEQDEQDGVVPPALGPPSVARTKQGIGGLPVDPHRQ